MDSYTRLLETLSPGGRQKLAAQISTLKTKIRPIEPRRR
jgi:hypothetical protein